MIRAGSLWRLVEARARATPHALFAVDEAGRRLDFAGLHHAALRRAAGLAERGMAPGDAVSWMLPTRIETLVLCAALSRLGAVQNPILPIYRERELGFITGQTGARWLFVPGLFRGVDYRELAAAARRGRPELEVVCVDDALPEGDPGALPPAREPSPDEVLWIFYTSGTTSDPKGARHSDATLEAFSLGMARRLALREDDRVALVFPVTHIGGVGWLFAGLAAGCAHLVVEVFDPDTSIPWLAARGITQATAGTAFHQAYLAAQRRAGPEPLFPAVRSFPGGGAPKPPALHFEVKREIGGAGIVSGYGLTECPILAMNAVDDPDDKLAETEGRPSPDGVQIRVVRPDGAPAGPGQEGELRVRGPQLFLGYVDPALDGPSRDEAGFFRTGDLGLVDGEGFVHITGRIKDVILRKGETLSAREIEDALFEHPEVAEVAVVGLPDAERGELACAVVVDRDPGRPASLASLGAFLRDRGLAPQKIPERLEHLDALPRNPTGKVLKQALQERFTR